MQTPITIEGAYSSALRRYERCGQNNPNVPAHRAELIRCANALQAVRREARDAATKAATKARDEAKKLGLPDHGLAMGRAAAREAAYQVRKAHAERFNANRRARAT